MGGARSSSSCRDIMELSQPSLLMCMLSFVQRQLHPSQLTAPPSSPAAYPPISHSWRVLHESPPLRGATYAPLPACVVEVSESCLYGIYCVQMFYALGCTCTHRITRKNCTYVCVQGGLELTVRV